MITKYVNALELRLVAKEIMFHHIYYYYSDDIPDKSAISNIFETEGLSVDIITYEIGKDNA